MSDNYEQWSQRFMLSIGENPYASPLWDNANLDEDDISVPVPGNWEILKRSPWVHYHPQNRRLPNQGWKIHTSTIPEQAEQHLSIVSKIMQDNCVAFKHLDSVRTLKLQNGKYAQRGASGKFITIYPKDTQEFLLLLSLLEESLSGMVGPYILSDTQYGQSPLFFRYGAFKLMKNKVDSDTEKFVIYDDNGIPYEDKREATFSVPDFVVIPEKIKPLIDSRLNPDLNELYDTFAPYKIDGALHFSNSGGVYTATSRGKKYVIKEARAYTGLDYNNNFAVDRLANEADILKKLSDTKRVAEYVDYRISEGNAYLIEEYVEGITLQSWIATNFPFYTDDKDIKAYEKRALRIAYSLKAAIDTFHSKGIALTDLQTKNILVDSQDQIKFIDLEFATNSNFISSNPPTPGFSPTMPCSAKERDEYALLICTLTMFSPPFNSYVTPSAIRKRIDLVADHFSSSCTDLLKQLLSSIPEKHFASFKSTEPVVLPSGVSSKMKWVKEQIVIGIMESLSTYIANRAFPGDVECFNIPGGDINIATGLTGALLFVTRADANTDIAIYLNHIIENINKIDSLDGLLYGRAGVYAALCEMGIASEVVESLIDTYEDLDSFDTGDLSLASGLSGTLISLIRVYEYTRSRKLLAYLRLLEDRLEEFIHTRDISIGSKYNQLGANSGLWHGWAGISVACSLRAEVSDSERWEPLAILALERETELLEIDDTGKEFVEASGILYPYLRQGSAGVAYAFSLLAESEFRSKHLERLLKVCFSPFPTLYAGLANGYLGILAIQASCTTEEEVSGFELEKRILMAVELYGNKIICQKGLNILSDGAYYLSSDYSTGGSGLIAAILSIEERKCLWFPLANRPQTKPS